MRKALVFAGRNEKEILRDIITLIFGILFPIVMLLLLSAINGSIPSYAKMTLFEIGNLAPGVAVFGLSFVSLFIALIVSKDRCSSFILRLFTSPLKSYQYILGYTLPLVVFSFAQTAVCYGVALVFGLKLSVSLLVAIAVNIPVALMYIFLGLLCGTVFNDKMVGGVCGALLTNLSAWLSSTWFDVSMVGGGFEKVAELLPFIHCVKAGRAAINGEYGKILPELVWVLGYTAVIALIAVLLFNRKMKEDK